MKIEKLIYAVQNYEWGRLGSASEVAKLKKCTCQEFVIDEARPYAELWMGVHPNGPSMLQSTDQLLSKHLGMCPDALGVHERGTLQFLFKVLSVNKALSIQSHPDKAKAKILHERDPAHYPDANHKPEMAIALTDFKLLCGFRQSSEIVANINGTPEFMQLLTNKNAVNDLAESSDDERKKAILKDIFSEYMRSAHSCVKDAVEKLTKRLKSKSTRTEVDELMLQLCGDYPADVGVFAPLLLNYFTLRKGESVFLGPNSPHAYLSGECLECMACSDNTVRAGLTPKFKDVDTLCSDLTFLMMAPQYFNPTTLGPGLREYAPPVDEFAVEEIQEGTKQLRDLRTSSILLVITGKACMKSVGQQLEISRGDAWFIPATTGPLMIDGVSTGFLAYRAYTPSR